MDLDLRLVRYFVAVADDLHFGRAAARLYISQPALSKQIRKLEDQVGPLFERDSRHVTLTPRGEQFLGEARQLLSLASAMQRRANPLAVRIAHIFELSTSRDIVDAFIGHYPDAQVLEHAMDSATQLQALLENRLDVGILRIAPRMLAEHPAGWKHTLLRLEPMLLVGRLSAPRREQWSLYDGPMEVFGDPPESGSYNAHGNYLTALENDLSVTLQWLGTPGAFSLCSAHMARAAGQARVLEFASYAARYAAHGFPVYHPIEAQPYYPWSLAWRDEEPTEVTADLLRVAMKLAGDRQWTLPAGPKLAPAWLPPDDPVRSAIAPS